MAHTHTPTTHPQPTHMHTLNAHPFLPPYTHTSHTHTDALVIRVLQRGFMMLGDMVRLRGFLVSIMPYWTEEMLLYPAILAL